MGERSALARDSARCCAPLLLPPAAIAILGLREKLPEIERPLLREAARATEVRFRVSPCVCTRRVCGVCRAAKVPRRAVSPEETITNCKIDN